MGLEVKRMGRNRSVGFRRDLRCFDTDLKHHFLQLEKDWRPFFHWYSPSGCSYKMNSQVIIRATIGEI